MIFNEYRNVNMVTWRITRKCNFKCAYCDVHLREFDKEEAVSPKAVKAAFHNVGNDWIVHFTGGEPFCYPSFVEICKLVSENNKIAINTNLSHCEVERFSEEILPKSIVFVNAAAHVVERERINGFQRFFDNIHFLQNRGFKVDVSYVAHPSLLKRIEKDVQFLKYNGVNSVVLKVFRGLYNRKIYPQAYTDIEKNLIQELVPSTFQEQEIILKKTNFFLKPCNAGKRFFLMEPNGDTYRCSGVRQKRGNLIKGTLKLDDEPDICPSLICVCPYEGIRNSNVNFKRKFSLSSSYKVSGDIVAKFFLLAGKISRKITDRVSVRY